ncbi:MAG: DUF1800 domain-containing protein [Chitinophagaceae bacterium]|nr:DUF1800 domain-containing protein [Chitinophagaceae bacterium]
MVPNQLKNQHLLWRAGFGPMAEEFGQLTTASQKSYVEALFKASSKSPGYIDVASNALKGLVMGMDEIAKQNKQLSDEEKKQFRQQSRQDIKNLNLTWLNEMVNSGQQLREKLSLFWHGHFASRNLNILYQQQLLDVIRKNALGSFGDLLTEVSKSAAMINFLNNNQNRKGHPNENFAREVMELFTLGRGNYTESDVKEAARSFTGWGANVSGEFVFRKPQHDTGQKTVLGKTGNLTGDDVLDILLEQKQTARFVTQKIYRYFVNDQPDENKINWLSERFYKNNYNIQSLMKDIFSSDWFYEEKNIGSKIKSPVELIVGIRRILPMEIENADVQLLLQRLLGQLLFYPPNVAGWPGGKNWIDSSSLMLRLRIPQMIYVSGELNMKPKDDDDQMMGRMDGGEAKKADARKNKGNGKMGAQIVSSIDWNMYLKKFERVPREKLLDEMSKILLQTTAHVNDNTIKKFTDASSRESFIKTATIQLMSTPEYQLC